MLTRSLFRSGAGLAPLAAILLGACAADDTSRDSLVDPQASATSLSVSFAAVGAAATNSAGNAVLVGTAQDTMVITSVQLVLGNVKIRRSGVTACPDSIAPSTVRGRSADDRGCSRLDLGPMLLDLPLSGATTAPLNVTVPAGTYSEIEFELDDVRTDSRATPAEVSFLSAHPEFRNTTVRVRGTYKGTAFTFVSRLDTEVEFEFEPTITVEAGKNDNIGISLDLAAWFKNSAGAILAPVATNQLAIEQKILSSFNAFGDADRDGRQDSGRGRGRGRGRDSGGSGSDDKGGRSGNG
jgi:uncharacterized membrane protein YgcG